MHTMKRTSLYTLLFTSFLTTGCLGKLEKEALETMQQVQRTMKELRKEVKKLGETTEKEAKKGIEELRKISATIERIETHSKAIMEKGKNQ